MNIIQEFDDNVWLSVDRDDLPTIAAAPDLLAVCERFVAACNAYLPPETHQAFCGLFASADEAIAKAKGEA